MGAPRVTLMNAIGNDIEHVTISLGTAKRQVLGIKDGQSVTVRILGHFSASSTHVTWTDSMGRHEEVVDDYMEVYGFYHTVIVLTPDRKARAIHEINESNILFQRSAKNRAR